MHTTCTKIINVERYSKMLENASSRYNDLNSHIYKRRYPAARFLCIFPSSQSLALEKPELIEKKVIKHDDTKTVPMGASEAVITHDDVQPDPMGAPEIDFKDDDKTDPNGASEIDFKDDDDDPMAEGGEIFVDQESYSSYYEILEKQREDDARMNETIWSDKITDFKEVHTSLSIDTIKSFRDRSVSAFLERELKRFKQSDTTKGAVQKTRRIAKFTAICLGLFKLFIFCALSCPIIFRMIGLLGVGNWLGFFGQIPYCMFILTLQWNNLTQCNFRSWRTTLYSARSAFMAVC